MDKLSFKLDVFEGPLDLLLHLINKNKVNILDIPIVDITNQYFEALSLMKGLDLEISSEFLVMAAQLLYIKSRMLLPKPKVSDEDEEDPRTELVERLLEYQRYKQASQFLKEREFSTRFLYFKPPENIEPQVVPYNGTYTLDDLLSAFSDVLERNALRSPPPKRTFEGIVRQEKVSVKQKLHTIMNLMRKRKRVMFSELFDGLATKPEMVATFLALLELIRMSRVLVDYKAAQKDFVLTVNTVKKAGII